MLALAILGATGCAGPRTVGAAPDPSLFDAGFENRSGLTFSPDGASAYWVEWDGDWGASDQGRRAIYTSTRTNRAWSAPQPVPFSGSDSDDDPFVSPDGRWLYFVSDRPVDDAADAGDTNIWRYRLNSDDAPEYLSINSMSAEYSPVVTASGALYFASARDGGIGQGDIYRASAAGDGFATAEALGAAVNSPTGEWNVWVSADESELIFEASSRPTNVSIPGDLYFSRRTSSGWSNAESLTDVNTAGSELMPRLHPDGETLYYTTAPIGGHARIETAHWPTLRSGLGVDSPARRVPRR